VARALLALGVQRGDRVGIWSPNVAEWMLTQYAAAKVGAILVNVNPSYRLRELEYALNQSGISVLIAARRFRQSDYVETLVSLMPELTSADDGPLRAARVAALRHVVYLGADAAPGGIAWTEFIERAQGVGEMDLRAREATLQFDDPANIQYTSGTTGSPKGATLSHHNILNNGFFVGERLKYTADDRIAVPVPFYHCFGCVLGTLACAVYGATMIVPAEYFQPLATLDAIEKHRASSLYGVPTMFIAELQDPSLPGRNLKSLRTGIMAGAPCPIEVMKQVENVLGARELTIAYGQTEASPVVTQTRYDDPTELRVETVGRLIPGVEAKIIDPATGNSLPDNTQGEFCCRGHVVMLGYYKNPEATAAAIDKEGWLHSGDLAIRLPNGYYKITGRLKDMVIRGGENIYPREIEEFLFTHPAVEQAAVFGIPDAKYGEELAAWIKLKAGQQATADEIREFCKQKLAHYKVPRHVRLVDSFPQTVTGKIQKFRMRDIMKQELGLQEQATA
jgi:fatty-acyl-CoA synthase